MYTFPYVSSCIVYKRKENGGYIMSENCDIDLHAGTWEIGPFEVIGGQFDPSKSVAGFRPGDGDTHGDAILVVPNCSE